MTIPTILFGDNMYFFIRIESKLLKYPRFIKKKN